MPNKVRKRVLSVILTLTILLSLCPPYAPASAEPVYDGLCVHHPAHTGECGYREAAEGQLCTHIHDGSCGYTEAVEENPCDMECTDRDGDGIADHAQECAFLPAAEGSPCTHTHDETCGYAEGVEASPCTYAVNGCPYCVVSWEWVDDQQLLNRLEDGWGMGLPGAGEDIPLTREAVAELLPGAITAMTHSGEEVTLEIAWDMTALPEESIPDGDYSLTAALPEAYALTDEAEALAATLQVGGVETYTELELPSGDPPLSEHIINGLSPNGTTIDLFDYWITSQTAADVVDMEEEFINQGINANHALLFGKGMNVASELGSWNIWTGEEGPPWAGIVADTLGEDGFPVLNLAGKIDNASKLAGRNGTESLAYLFDTNRHDGKAAYTDVRGLLQVDEDGYYYYYSTKNYAVFYADANSFVLYDLPGVTPGGSSPVGQFFPFNAADEKVGNVEVNNKKYSLVNTQSSLNKSINHYFGMHMSTRFIQQNGGYTDRSHTTPVTYEFSGDDDIWIFIDGILVADLGGIHNTSSVKIDFASGEIEINDKSQPQKLGELLEYGTATLPDNTYHTLDFFYLERGNTDSNMNLKYNLVTIPESNLIKVDQLGEPVPGAEFKLYAANDPANPIAVGTTDHNGEFVFLNDKDMPITIEDLYRDYSNVGKGEESDLILAETRTPDGYRSSGKTGLYFYESKKGEVLLLSNSVWDKGSYAMPKVTSTAPKVIRSADDPDRTVTLSGYGAVENPLMFAVVFQKQGENWYPVSGDPVQGWKVWENSNWENVLAAALASPYLFQIASNGAYQVEVSNLPGDIRDYYHICMSETQAKYTIGYYYTSARTLAQANKENTWRIDSDPLKPEDSAYALERVFSMDLYVSNIKNRLLVQKVDEARNPVNEAEFYLYEASAMAIVGGKLQVKEGATYYDKVKTADIRNEILNLDGGGIFPTDGKVLKEGEYYLVEETPPYGYVANSTPVHIVVDNTGVYADAGTQNDGITVLRGVGSVMRSVVQFATDDGVDITLHDIMATRVTSGSYTDGSFAWSSADWETGDVLHLQYANENKMLDYGLYDTDVKGTLDNLTLATETGWSKLLIRQCYDHKGTEVPDPLKTDLGDRDLTNLFSGTVTVRVTNVRKIVDVIVEKKVTGNLGDHTKQFAFEVQSSLPMEKDANYNLSDDGKIATFSLAHNESVTLRVPVGALLTISETFGDYESTITVDDKPLKERYTVTDADTQTITVTNHKNVVIDTGIVLDALPYVVLLGIVAVGAILLLRRRRRRE